MTETPAHSKVGALYELTKPGIAGYVMMTAGVSYYVASGGQADILPITHTLLGVAPGTAGPPPPTCLPPPSPLPNSRFAGWPPNGPTTPFPLGKGLFPGNLGYLAPLLPGRPPQILIRHPDCPRWGT